MKMRHEGKMSGKKLLCTLFLAAALLLGGRGAAQAIDFKVSGEWLVGFGAGTGELYSKYREPGHGPKTRTNTNDVFEANQRLRLLLSTGILPSQSGFCVISMHFTATPRIPHTSRSLKKTSFNGRMRLSLTILPLT